MEPFNLDNYIMHHITNSNVWKLPFLPDISLPAPLSVHALMLVICATILGILFGRLYNKRQLVPRRLTNALEALVLFVRDEIAIAYLGEKDGRRMTPFFCTLFFFILGLNLMGLIPLFSTATSNINVTAALAFITLTIMTAGTVVKSGAKGFWKALKPSGVPVAVLFLLIPIEVAGLFIKACALTIRLFANMLAGHIVILSLLGLIVLMGMSALPALLLALFIYILEILVAFLQAYIFTLLSAMFIGQMHHPEH